MEEYTLGRHSELSRDIANSTGGPLNSDWKRFAKDDFKRLKDEVLALKEFICPRKEKIRKRLNKEKHGLSLKGLAKRLGEEKAVDDILRTRLVSRVGEMDEKDLREKAEEFQDRLERISKWLLTLDGVRAEV